MNTTSPPLPSPTDAERQLSSAGIRVTAVRTMIWRALSSRAGSPFSLADAVRLLPTVERSTMFRTLGILKKAGLLHEVDDGSGTQRYCVCHCDDRCHHRGHVHLTCVRCHKTQCLTDVLIPAVPLPQGFEVEEAEYVVKGVCAKCLRKYGR